MPAPVVDESSGAKVDDTMPLTQRGPLAMITTPTLLPAPACDNRPDKALSGETAVLPTKRRLAAHQTAYDSSTDYRLALEHLRRYSGGRLPGGKRLKDYGAYLPSPEEIEQRKRQLRYLQRLGFTDRFIASVMQNDSPTFAMVLGATRRGLTAAEIAAEFKRFLKRTEYDAEGLLRARRAR